MADSHQNPEELDTIVEITGILTGRLSFLEKCESTLAALARFTGADLVILREWDPDNFKLDLVASYDFLVPPEDILMSISVSTGMASETLRTGIPAVVNNYPAKETLIQGYLDSGVKSSMVLPVLIDAEIFGTLSFASRFLDHFQEDTVRMLVAVGAVVGMMIAKAGPPIVKWARVARNRPFTAPRITAPGEESRAPHMNGRSAWGVPWLHRISQGKGPRVARNRPSGRSGEVPCVLSSILIRGR